MKAQIEALEREKATTKDLLDKANGEIVSLKEKLAEVKHQQSQTQTQLDSDLKATKAALEQKKAELAAKIFQNEQYSLQKQSEIANLDGKLRESHSECDKLKQSLSQKTQELETIKDLANRTNTTNEATIKRLDERIRELTADVGSGTETFRLTDRTVRLLT